MTGTPRIVQLYSADAHDPIPEAIRVNDTIFAPALTGRDPTTGRLVDGLLPQMEAALGTMRAMLQRAGASLDNVGRVVGYVSRVEDRDPIYDPWDAAFPDPADRPAFKVLVAKLPPGVLVQLSMLALVGGRRRRIDIPGVPARDPTVIIGNWVFSSRVHGTDPATGASPDSPDEQGKLAYGNLLRLIELAGGSPSDIHQVTAFIRDPANTSLAERHFARSFPDAPSRPKHWILDAFIRPHLAVMAELVATCGDDGPGERITEIFARPDLDPIPEAIHLGPVLYAPAICGHKTLASGRAESSDQPVPLPAATRSQRSPESRSVGEGGTQRTPAGFEAQLRAAVQNLEAMLRRAGATLREVGHVSVFMSDLANRPTLNSVWSELYPDPNDRPPHTYVPARLPEGELVRLGVIAVPSGQRRVLEIPGLRHHDPMSMGATIGGLLFSSRIVGTDTATGITPPDPADQAEHAFRNARTLLERAGGDPDNLTQVTAYIGHHAYRADVEAAWAKLFPDPATRPSLQFLELDLPGHGVRLEIKASL